MNDRDEDFSVGDDVEELIIKGLAVGSSLDLCCWWSRIKSWCRGEAKQDNVTPDLQFLLCCRSLDCCCCGDGICFDCRCFSSWLKT